MKRFVAVLLLLGALLACRVGAEAPMDVPRDHWAYDAVRSLVEAGYMEGYSDGSFLGNRVLTRYEFATVIKRVVDGMAERMAHKASVDPAKPAQSAASPGVKPEDMDAVRKLVDEFKPELAVIGARLDKLEAAMDETKADIEDIRTILTDEEGPLQSTKADVSKLKKIGVSGYVQTRYYVFSSNPDKIEELSDTFSVRRARLKVVGKPTDKSSVTVQFDGGQGSKADSGPSVTTKDAFVEYYFTGNPATGLAASLSARPIVGMAMGQMKWPFGYEVVQSSSVRETPERSLIVQRLFPGERDRGFMAACPLGSVFLWRVGVFNGNETRFGDPNNNKDGVTALRFDYGDIAGGVSGYYGKGIVDDAGDLYLENEDPKWRYGADLQYYINRLTLKAEYMAGKGVDGMRPAVTSTDALYKTITGGYAQAAFNVTPADTLVAKYDTISLDVKYPSFGRRSAWNLGIIRQLDAKNRLKAFYQVNQEENHDIDNNQFAFEWITTF